MPINSIPVRQEVTAEVLRVLFNNCAALRSIGRQHEQYFEQRTPVGTTLQIKRPWRPKGRTGQAFQPEPIVQTTVPLSISYWRGGDFIYNDTDEALFMNMERFHEDYSRPLGIMIANQIDADLLSYMQVTTPNFVGTPGTTPNTTAAYNNARTSLNKLLAPDQDRSVIWTSEYEANMVGQSQTIFNPSNVIGKQYLTGVVGEYAGFTFLRDEQIPAFTGGTYTGSGQVNAANQSGSSIVLKSFTGSSVSFVPGDRLTFAGVYKVNPSGNHNVYTGAANLMQFVITAPAVDDGSGNVTVQIYPPLIPSGQFQNCSASPAANAAVTVATTTGQLCNTAFAFQKEAYTAAFLKLHKPSDVQAEVMGGDESGTPGIYIRSIRQWQSSGPYAGYETERMDAIYGFAAQYADFMSCVIYG
jgi:hypothetical protein